MNPNDQPSTYLEYLNNRNARPHDLAILPLRADAVIP